MLVCTTAGWCRTEDHAGREALLTHDAYFSSLDLLARPRQSLCAGHAAAPGPGRGSCVVEVASNDGYLLQYVQQAASYGASSPQPAPAKAAQALGLEVVGALAWPWRQAGPR